MPEGPPPTRSDPPADGGGNNQETTKEEGEDGNKKAKNENAAPVFPVTASEELTPTYLFPHSEKEDIVLPEDYRPTKYDVINGRGRKSYNHIGNRRFRQLTAMNLKRYQSANCKVDKTLVVIGIVNSIRKSSPCGGFIKKCPKTGCWISMSNEAAREKVGHCLRDMIASQRMDSLYGKATKALAFQSRHLQWQQQEKFPDGRLYSMPTKLEALHGITAEPKAIGEIKDSSSKLSSPSKLIPRASTELSRGAGNYKKDENPTWEMLNWNGERMSDYPVITPGLPPTRSLDPPTHHLPGSSMAISPEMISKLPSNFTNFEVHGKKMCQDMSLQQRQILQMLEGGFQGTVEELIEACKPNLGPLPNFQKMESNHLLDQHRNLIIGGHYIEKGRYPYYVSIDKNNGVIVGGALIAKDIVLSAGHVALDHMGNLTLKIGTYNPHEDPPTFSEEIAVEQWVVPNGPHTKWEELHPGYFTNDYMIFKLAHESTHDPVRLNRNPNTPKDGDFVTIMGLGWTNATFWSPSPIVKEIEMVYVDNDACANSSDPLRGSYKNVIDKTMLCTAMPPNTTRDACAWDSGDPVIIAGENSSQDILVGLGSTGVGCADLVFPSIQARVSAGMDWIEMQVCKLSVDPPHDFDCSGFVRNSTVAPVVPGVAQITTALYPKSSSLLGKNTEPSLSSGSATVFLTTCSLMMLFLGGFVQFVRHRRRRRRNQTIGKLPNKEDDKHNMLNVQLHRTNYDSIDP